MKKTSLLKALLNSDALEFLCEAHNGVSAKIVEEAGFRGIWGSGLTLSAAMGVRDNNEVSWTQVIEAAEFMCDATSIPILLDGDTGYGNFNNVRRLVQKLEQKGVAGVCIEDKLFPKTNSFLREGKQPLASPEEFCGKIRAAKDAARDGDFCVVARTEALIAGWGLAEALRRADSYRQAGADAILIHSKLSRPDEVLAFKKEWGDRSPVVIVPTTYYRVPMDVFQNAGFSVVIWANMILRASIAAMQDIASRLRRENSLVDVVDRIAPLKEVFRLQGDEELERAEKRYLPAASEDVHAVILAASGGEGFDVLTRDRPKAMLEVGGVPILFRQIKTLNDLGIRNITVVRGYQKDVIEAPNLRYVDNDDYRTTQELVSLQKAVAALEGPALVSYGDILYKKYIPQVLLEDDSDFTIAVDSDWSESSNRGRYADYVKCSLAFRRGLLDEEVFLEQMGTALDRQAICGEWIGLFRLSSEGTRRVREILESLSRRENFSAMRMADLFNALLQAGDRVRVHYIRGHWLDVDDLKSLSTAHTF